MRIANESPKDGDTSSSSIIFLRGQPSPHWLSVIGAMYHVDPEYFQRHLDFRSTVGKLNYFPLPSLPSSSNQVIKLRYITTGQRDNDRRRSDQTTVDSLRSGGAKAVERYMHALNQSIESGSGSGDSIVRAYNVHDETYFTIEQDISIYVNRTSNGWICTLYNTFCSS